MLVSAHNQYEAAVQGCCCRNLVVPPNAKAMLIKESVLCPEIFQILSASQAKKTHRKKNTGQHKVEFFMQ